MGRVARLGIVVNDLDRSRLAWLGAWLLGHLLTGNRYTRHDAPLSVRRAYRLDEAVALLRAAGLAPVRTDPRPLSAPRTRSPRSGPTDPDRRRRPDGTAMAAIERVEVAVVGGGPAGAVAGRPARPGRPRRRRPRARRRRGAGGPAACSRRPRRCAALRRAGLASPVLAAVARPIPAMRVETPGGTTFRLTYGADAAANPPSGSTDRALDPALLDLARAAGAEVRPAGRSSASTAQPAGSTLRATGRRPATLRGAMSSSGRTGCGRSSRGRPASTRPARLAPRLGLTYHLADPGPDGARATPGCASCATATSGSRRSRAAGSTSGSCWAGRGGRALARDGARAVADAIVARIPAADDDPRRGATARRPTRRGRVADRPSRRRAGPGDGWLLVGDAAGFLDPFTGEGLHRALVSAELAAPRSIGARARGRREAFDAYERAMHPPVPRQGRACRGWSRRS